MSGNLDIRDFNNCYPSLPSIDLCSPNASLIESGGIMIYNDVDINGVGAAEVITNIFTYTGEFILNRLWLVITDATEITTLTNVHFDVWDGTASVVLTLDGLDMSGVSIHSVAVKDALVASALELLNADQVRYVESAFNKAFVGGIVGHKASTTCYLRLRVTTDANTDISVRVCLNYMPLDFDTTLVTS